MTLAHSAVDWHLPKAELDPSYLEPNSFSVDRHWCRVLLVDCRWRPESGILKQKKMILTMLEFDRAIHLEDICRVRLTTFGLKPGANGNGPGLSGGATSFGWIFGLNSPSWPVRGTNSAPSKSVVVVVGGDVVKKPSSTPGWCPVVFGTLSSGVSSSGADIVYFYWMGVVCSCLPHARVWGVQKNWGVRWFSKNTSEKECE